LRVSADGRVHLTQSGADMVRTPKTRPGTAIETLEGLPVAQVQQRVQQLMAQASRSQR
jgi:hypothetical protein